MLGRGLSKRVFDKFCIEKCGIFAFVSAVEH
jgi:hypothetical protein